VDESDASFADSLNTPMGPHDGRGGEPVYEVERALHDCFFLLSVRGNLAAGRRRESGNRSRTADLKKYITVFKGLDNTLGDRIVTVNGIVDYRDIVLATKARIGQ
jgi:hypothetical protein